MSDDNECPVCGQPYDHKRTERHDFVDELRSDARECKTPTIGGIRGEKSVYVHHVDHQQITSVTQAVRPDRNEPKSILGAFFR